MATYRFTFTDVTDQPFTDTAYAIYLQFVNTPSSGYSEAITFGDLASKNAAIASLTASIESTWSTNNVAAYFSIVSFTITEGTQSISLELVYDVSGDLFNDPTANPYNLGYAIQSIGIMNEGMSIYLGNQAYSRTITGIVDCTPVACDKCQEVVFSACQASYTIIAGLGSGTDYTVVLTDRNNVRYTQLITADTSGDLTIDTTDIPSSLFTPESGGFLVEVYEDAELTTKATITSGYYTYGCIQLSFQHTVTTTSSIPVQFNFLYTENDFVIDEYGNTFICN